MRVWSVCPSAAPIPQARLCFEAWRDMGYRVAVAVDEGATWSRLGADLAVNQDPYPGYAQCINALARRVLERDPESQVVVAFADDIWPDANRTARIIAEEFLMHFDGSLGVMQPTGDRWTIEGTVPQIDKAAMSPWLGRDWCLRSYQGQGPLWPGYRHCFVDNDLQEVATKLGVFQQRQDITHLHQHWLRIGNSMPPHAQHTVQSWDADKALFTERQAAGFPESELLPSGRACMSYTRDDHDPY